MTTQGTFIGDTASTENDIWVADFMSTKVVSCSPDTSLEEVVEELRTNDFSCLVILENERPVGMMTERALVRILSDLLGEENWESQTVKHFMSTSVKTIDEDRTLIEAVDLMGMEKIRRAPIIDLSGKLVCILSQSDIIRGFARAFRENAKR